jgi:capsular polysaccharide biosynthesis protein
MVESPQGQRPQHDDEISLVDLAATFLKRRRVFYIVFIVITLAGIAYAIFAQDKYEYVTLAKLAEKSGGEYIEEPSTVIAELDSLWVPDLQAKYHAENDRSLPFEVKAKNPEDTGLVRIVSEASASASTAVEEAHRKLVERLKSQQEQAVSALRKSLEKQIVSLDSTIKMLEEGENTGDAIASAVEKQLSLESNLQSLSPFEALVVSRQSGENAGPSRSLIVVLSIMLGLMAGVFIAFLAEFIGLVRNQLAGE